MTTGQYTVKHLQHVDRRSQQQDIGEETEETGVQKVGPVLVQKGAHLD